MAIRKRVYGDVHIQVALGDESLAGLTSDPDEAVKLHREAVSVFEQALGPSNSRTLDSMLRLGQRLLDQRRYDEALDVYREARSRALEAPGDADLLERLEALEADIRAAEAGSEPPASRR